MPNLTWLRHRRSKSVVFMSQTTTTTIPATTSVLGSSTDTSGFQSGVFLVNVVANASGAHGVFLQGRVDTTTWSMLATLDADMTTTANTPGMVAVAYLPDECRIVVGGATTTSALRLTVKADLLV